MNELLRARQIEKSFGTRPVLRGADLSVHAGERVGLVGVNGSGKSTLVRILASATSARGDAAPMEPDGGEVRVRGTLAVLDQDPVLPGRTVGESVEEAVGWHAALLGEYEAALTGDDMTRASALQARLDDVGWDLGHRVDAMLSRVGAPSRDATVETLSGGKRRRVALVRALLRSPDVLLLDEPTNHLDADAVEWLEGFLTTWRGALLIVTHDRYLLEAVATRIVEIEDGEAVSYDGSYADYLLLRAERRAALQRAEDSRLAMIAREAEWASRSPAAQTVKQKARLDRLAALMEKRPLKKEERFSLDLRTGLKHGSTVLELHGARMGFTTPEGTARTLFKDAELALRGGDRVAIVGANGAGKSTLLKLFTGELEATGGQVVRGARVRAAVLDQGRTGLDLDATVWEAAGGGNDQVRVGEGWVHVASFLSRFLFGREFHTRRVRELSGGERARLLLAKLLLQGANLLLLDEPTNDLDLQTLRVLEEALLDYDGVVIVVTHDRAFLDRVCNAVVCFEPAPRPQDGSVLVRYASRQQAAAARARADAHAREEQERADASARQRESAARATSAPAPRARLSFKEQRELDALPARISTLETEQATLSARLADPATYRDGTDVPALSRALQALETDLERAMERWAELAAR